MRTRADNIAKASDIAINVGVNTAGYDPLQEIWEDRVGHIWMALSVWWLLHNVIVGLPSGLKHRTYLLKSLLDAHG